MAKLPDPQDTLDSQDLETFQKMAQARANADGKPSLADVYVRMFNNPDIATKVGALGEQLRFHGLLPDHIREAIILRFASLNKLAYVWSHHQRPALLAGLTDIDIQQITEGILPENLDVTCKAALQCVDAIYNKNFIPDAIQSVITDKYGVKGIVEVVTLCGLYALVGNFCMAFDIDVEQGFPQAPF